MPAVRVIIRTNAPNDKQSSTITPINHINAGIYIGVTGVIEGDVTISLCTMLTTPASVS